MYGAVYSAIANGADRFEGSQQSGSMFLAALAILAILVIQLFVVRFLWNTVLVRVTSIAKPIPSLLYALGLLVLVAMVLPGSVL